MRARRLPLPGTLTGPITSRLPALPASPPPAPPASAPDAPVPSH